MANYEDFNKTVVELEGGFQKRASDPGNFNSKKQLVGTNNGISAPVYEKWIGYPPTEIDMRSLSKTVAQEIFKKNYWHRLKASYIDSQAVAETLVDHGINAGTGTAAKIMQRVLKEKFSLDIRVDGAIGAITIEAINSVNPVLLFQEFNEARIIYYERIGNSEWLGVWKNRVKSIANKFGIEFKKKQ